jgi:hypothetical protein
MRSIGRVFAGVAVSACIAVLAAPAGAGSSVPSSVTLRLAGGPPVHGRVTSKDPACVSNRKVLLIEVAPDRGPIDYADNRTSGKGKWVFSSQLQGATVVQAKVAESKASGITCRAAFSPVKSL